MDYIKLSRKILNWEWYGNINTCRLFIHMLLKANWKEGRFEGKTIPRGSFVSTTSKLASETNLTMREVRTSLEHLKATRSLAIKTYSKYSVFSITNYDSYQVSDTMSDKHSVTQTTNKRQTNDTLIEEREERKNINNILPPISPTANRFNDFFRAYPKQVHTVKAEEAYMQTLFDDTELDEGNLIQAAVNYSEAVKIQETPERYILNPENFLSKGTYNDYLPGNYKKPQSKLKKVDINQGMIKQTYDFEELERKLNGL